VSALSVRTDRNVYPTKKTGGDKPLPYEKSLSDKLDKKGFEVGILQERV